MIALAPPFELPARVPSPFALPPHPIAVRAAEALRATLGSRTEGKMFGVLVVRDGDRVGYLCAFSGMLDGAWDIPGFVGPVFDAVARDAFWPAGEADLAAIDRALDAARIAAAGPRDALAAFDREHATALDALRAHHVANRAARHAARAIGGEGHALDQASRADTAERRRFDTSRSDARAPLVAALRDGEVAALEARRTDASRGYLQQIFATYRFADARGAVRELASLFAPDAPPGGAGDCAAPKLFAHAYRQGLVPIALAEFWHGPPPPTGDRRHGVYYPACRSKCGPILAHVLGGLEVDPAPVFGGGAIDPAAPRTLFEDAWLAVVDKPVGLLSVPGRSGQLRDSVATRLRARWPGAEVVHRLDLDTSGVMLVAKDAATFVALQRMFARREIAKRYVAILDGDVAGDRGTIELALRVDVDDRPRQIVDPLHGKAAVTDWEVVARGGGRTRVVFVPHTGRTHQLRVHAAVGLGAPIAGDRLYGRDGERLLLHAERLELVHPHTGAPIVVELRAGF